MAFGLGRSSKSSDKTTSKGSSPSSGWTPEQKSGQAGLNARLSAARSAPAKGRQVPQKARRTGRMDD